MLNQYPVTLPNRACSSVPRRQVSLLGLLMSFIVFLDNQFRRAGGKNRS